MPVLNVMMRANYISRVYEDGNYAMAVYNQDYRLSVGDKIKTGNQELEIVCVTSEGVGSVSGAPTVVCSEKTFMRLTGECRFAMISVVLKKDVSEAAVSKIRDLVGDCLFVDNREENSDINGSYWVFRIASYGFLAIISLITVLNITNSISMGVSARIKPVSYTHLVEQKPAMQNLRHSQAGIFH